MLKDHKQRVEYTADLVVLKDSKGHKAQSVQELSFPSAFEPVFFGGFCTLIGEGSLNLFFHIYN